MKLGLLSACMPDRSLDEVAAWAGTHGFDTLELAAWPRLGGQAVRRLPHRRRRLRRGGGRTGAKETLERHGAGLSALAFYDNNLHPDPGQRQEIHDHVRACVDVAAALGGVPVGTFVGRDVSKSVAENLREAEQVFPPLVDYAGERGVRLMIENCVMEGWHPDGYPGNLAYSPELWEWMFDLGLWLNFDPSHLLWIGIDPVAALRPYVDKVIHAHAKDAETFPDQRNRYGFFGRMSTREEDPWDMGWWQFRVPGLGPGGFPRLRRGASRGRLRRRPLGRARGSRVGRLGRKDRGRPGDRPGQPPAAGGCSMSEPAQVTEEAPVVLEVRGLVKEYPGVKALKGVDFDVRAGEIHCLLGPNGAGKSTLIKCVSGAVEPTGRRDPRQRRAAPGGRPGRDPASRASRRSTRSSIWSRTCRSRRASSLRTSRAAGLCWTWRRCAATRRRS